ncbi:CCA tRNA nucleotidyltransferase [Phenylobacterium aquaticum]|uniref:CCA tRNA nucleotidyltransferase n=1 Tax=Phenylobacterium aquaticum TaxID=1763816 RepID=UPI0026EDEA2C|nr:CCA tRNA nucleotidyltransferase [Phenylobacterium aquaticum]
MTTPQAVAVLDALEAKGGPGCARFVGGCVRNTLLNRPIDDIDIATTLTPDEATAALEAAGLKAVPTGVEHGTITAVADGAPFEVTTLRRDVSTDGRRAVVAFSLDWAEDAQRRDFTLNAIYADRDGTLFDPTGQGIADARAGRIIFVGDAMTRIREDYLRILRFFRFLAWYGKGEPDAKALAACKALRDTLSGRPAERTIKELLKLLSAEEPRPAMTLMRETGVLGKIMPFCKDLDQFNGLVEIETSQLFENDAVLRLATLVPDDQVSVAKAAESLRLSNDIRDRLVAAMGKTPRIASWMSPRESRRAVYQVGVRAFTDRVKLAWAGSRRTAANHQWRGLLALGESWAPPPFPLTGDDVIHAGVPKGPMVGEVLREVEDWWIDHDFLDDKFSAIEKLKAVAQGMAY